MRICVRVQSDMPKLITFSPDYYTVSSNLRKIDDSMNTIFCSYGKKIVIKIFSFSVCYEEEKSG